MRDPFGVVGRHLVISLAASLLVLAGCATVPDHPGLSDAEAKGHLAPLLPARRFLANVDTAGGYQMSPDGLRWLWRLTVGTDAGLAWRKADEDEPSARYPVGNQGRGRGLATWLGDSRHFIYSLDPKGNENIQLFVQDADDARLNPWAVTPDSKVRREFVAHGPPGTARFLFGSNARDHASFDLYEADPVQRTVREVARNDGKVLTWLVSSAGQLAARLRQEEAADGSDQVLERLEKDGAWAPVLTVDGFSNFRVVRVDADGRTAWAMSNRGRDKLALVKVDLSGDGSEVLVADDPQIDLRRVWFAGRDGALLGVESELAYPKVKYLDKPTEKLVQTLSSRAVAEGVLFEPPRAVRPTQISEDGGRIKFWSESDFDDAEWTWDKASGRLERLDPHFPEIRRSLAPIRPFAFSASDGKTIRGLIATPVGMKAPSPLVVLIHGGPWARDHWTPAGFNALQMLVNRGYAVLQVNYRGSAGYGKSFMWAAERQFHDRLQQDIAEAAQWAINQGLADRQHMAVLGGSFGGYSVLAQLAQKRQPWRCGVDIVGVANWVRLREQWPSFWRNRHYFDRTFGDPAKPDERAFMLAHSPVSYLDQIDQPLLVIQGANDIRVQREDSDEVVAGLKALGRPVPYLLFKNEGHSISRWRNRLAMWREVEDFFAQCLGGRSAGFDLYEIVPR